MGKHGSNQQAKNHKRHLIAKQERKIVRDRKVRNDSKAELYEKLGLPRGW